MNSYSMITFYISLIGSIIAAFIFTNKIIKKVKTIILKESQLDKFTLIVYPIGLLITIFIAHNIMIPSIKDLPYVIKKDFKTVTGEFLDSSIARSNMSAHPGIRIKDDETGEVVSISLYYQPEINKGDRLTINYLPNTRMGNVKGKGYYGKDKY
ncbi:MAG TPA: hypothetical protein VK071_12375 [Tissierellales bacterium]|nr:hypothetical protein [Tissierellales bacterium]